MFDLHLISDSTGETLFAASKAAIAAFSELEMEVRLNQHVFVRTEAEIEAALEAVTAAPGPVFFTLVDPDRRDRVAAHCTSIGVEAVPLLDPMIAALSRVSGRSAGSRPGLQHQVDEDYFARIAALDFAIAHDDGHAGDRLMRADVILAGVSRTSKTPTCIYLAYRGVKAANMPLIPGRQPPDAFFRALRAGIPVIGLTASPSRLAQIRAERLEVLGDPKAESYADIDAIRSEVADARIFFEENGIPVIDVTRRSIEETTASILAMLRARGRA